MDKRRIKIIRVFGSLGNGGAETVSKNQLRIIDKEQFDMVVAVSGLKQETPNSDAIKEAGVRIEYFGLKSGETIDMKPDDTILYKAYCRIIYRIYAFFRRIRMFLFFLKERPDIVQLHLSACYLNRLQYYLLQKIAHVKYCYTCHSTPAEKFHRKSERRMAQFLIDHCGMKMIALHEEMENELQEMFKTQNTALIHNGIDLIRFSKGKDRNVTRKELGIPEDAWVIGHVGRFVSAKNHEFLLDVFKRILETDNSAYLLLIGDGELREQFIKSVKEARIEDHIVMIRHSLDIPDLMRAMDVFALPSVREGFVNVLLEAQVCGLPCVVSDLVNNEPTVSDKICFIHLDKELWTEKLFEYRGIKNCTDERIKRFSIEGTTKELETLYKEIVNENSIC